MTTTLYRGGRIHSPTDPHATALLVDGETVVWVGADADAPAADETVALDGALVTPAFVDAHVHATDTGLTLTGLDLSGARSASHLLELVAAAADRLPADAVVLGQGWDESTWDAATPAGSGAATPVGSGAEHLPPDAAALDRAAGGRTVYAAQASMHSALCSSALLAQAAGQPGFDEGGWVRREAHHAVRAAALAAVGTAQRAAAQRAALQRAASLGIAAVHECGGPGISSKDDFTSVLGQEAGPEVYGYWGELMGAATAKELGAVGAGGDLFADGALGAHTAHLRDRYHDHDGHGTAYLTSEQVRDHLLDCHEVGVQGGFHAIGDAALATVLAGFAAAADRLGVERLRAARHRIEHAELVDRDMIAAMVEYGVVASVQPAFDRLWGGEHQMYARRLGTGRALAANPLGAMHSVGVSLAFGSDSPVTPLGPWGGVRAAARHHNPAHRLSVRAAFAAHTRGGWRAVGQDQHGVLTLGVPATFAVWQTPAGRDGTLPVLDAGAPLPTCRRTVLRGRTIWSTS